MDEQSTPQDVQATPVATENEPVQVEPEAQPQTIDSADAAMPSAESSDTDEEFDYPNYQLPPSSPLDFSQLPTDENNLIDPNALAGTINQSIAAAEERATMRAQQAYAEQRAEEKAWEKAYEKHPELKTNKELRDLVQNARMGEVTNLLSRATTQEQMRATKLPSPAQMAEKLFKYMGNAKQEGFKQATENTVVQQSAHVETATRRTDDSADAATKAFQNINNPNKEVANKARNDLLRQRLGW